MRIFWKNHNIEIPIQDFPIYTSLFGKSGYVVLTWDKKLIFFSILYDEEYKTLDWEDVTDQFDIL